jgi:ribosomal-protein-alanine N-acetyltransferase
MSHLRAISALDASALSATHARCFEKPWSERDFRHWLARPDVIGVGLSQSAGSPLIGFGLLLSTGEEADLVTIAVEPAERGTGNGRHLLTALLAQAQAAGVQRVVLEVAQDNGPAFALYQRLGFLKIGTRHGYYPRQDAPAVDAHLMAKALEPVV